MCYSPPPCACANGCTCGWLGNNNRFFIPCFGIAQLSSLVGKWRSLLILIICFAIHGHVLVFAFALFFLIWSCCCVTMAKVYSSGILSEGCHQPWLSKFIYLLCVLLNRVSGEKVGILATVGSKNKICDVHSAGALILCTP